MANVARVSRVKQAETEIAVLQVQFQNMDEKIDDLKIELQSLRDHLSECSKTTHSMIKDMQEVDQAAHRALERKVTNLEKWRWMIMGAGILLGYLGFEAVSKLFTVG